MKENWELSPEKSSEPEECCLMSWQTGYGSISALASGEVLDGSLGKARTLEDSSEELS